MKLKQVLTDAIQNAYYKQVASTNLLQGITSNYKSMRKYRNSFAYYAHRLNKWMVQTGASTQFHLYVTAIPTKICLHHHCLRNPTGRQLVVVHSKYPKSMWCEYSKLPVSCH